MTRLRHGMVLLAVLFWVTAQAWAAPRVALVIPISGDVKLAGATLDKPKLAEEGQKVTVAPDSEVRIQLLGSSKEKILKGKADYTISKAGLEKEGKALDRGAVSVVSEIGNLSRAGAGSQRGRKPLGLSFILPPVLEKNRWVLRVASPEVNATEKNQIHVTISDLTDPSAENLEKVLTNPVKFIDFDQSQLIVGHQYRVFVLRDTVDYERDFRILTSQEQAALKETERTLRRAALESDEMPTLIRLASLYKSFDQNEKMAKVLLEAVKKPSYKKMDPEVQKQLVEALNRARKSLDQVDYVPQA